MTPRHLVGFLAVGCFVVAVAGCSGDSTGTNDNNLNNNNPICGDGVVNGTEQCDGADLGGETCQSQGRTSISCQRRRRYRKSVVG